VNKRIKFWIKKEREKAEKYLIKLGFKLNKTKGFFWKKIQFKNKYIYLRVVLPGKYPLEYPKFYIDRKSWFLKYPHVEKYDIKYGSGICYLDKYEQIAVFDGTKLIEQELKRIYKILESYDKNTYNSDDFLFEFDSYWNEKSYYLDLPELLNTEAKLVWYLQVDRQFKNIITSNKNQTEYILNNLGLLVEKVSKILYLPLENNFTFPFPQSKKQFMSIVRKSGYEQYVLDNIDKSNPLILFSFIIENYRHFAGVEFPKPFIQPLSDPAIIPIRIIRIDRKRIFSRGSNFLISDIAKIPIKIAIIGCGSLGASLAFKLAKSGIKKLTLIDNDFLTIDNIGRHICGMRYISLPKVEAVKSFLLEQFPDMEIDVHNKNAIDVLDILDLNQLIVTAVGSEGESLEQLLLQMKHSKNNHLLSPLIVTWFEGGVGGHVVLVKNSDIDDINLLVSKISIIDDTKQNDLIKLDMGCNSVYTPYSYLEAEHVVVHATNFILKFILSKGDMSEEIWTIFNDTKQYNELLKTKFKLYSPYTVYKRLLKEVL